MSTAKVVIKDVNGVTVMDTASKSVSVVTTASYVSGTLVLSFNKIFEHIEVLFQPIYPTDTTHITHMPSYIINYDTLTVTFEGGTATSPTLIILLGK